MKARKPPHLVLLTEVNGDRMWVIRDGQSDGRTWCKEFDYRGAQKALREYIRSRELEARDEEAQ